MNMQFFQNTAYSVDVFLYSLLAISALIAVSVWFSRQYQFMLKYNRLQTEMRALDFRPEEEAVMNDLTRRYIEKEPCEALDSLPLFDQIAQREIERVLSTPGSCAAKEEFVRRIYEIRQKAFFSHLMSSSSLN